MAAAAWAIQRSTPLIMRPIPYGWAVFTKTEVDHLFPRELEEQFPLPAPPCCDYCGEELPECQGCNPHYCTAECDGCGCSGGHAGNCPKFEHPCGRCGKGEAAGAAGLCEECNDLAERSGE